MTDPRPAVPSGTVGAALVQSPPPLVPLVRVRARGMLALWSAEAKLPPLLKLTLQHSKARLPSPAAQERGCG